MRMVTPGLLAERFCELHTRDTRTNPSGQTQARLYRFYYHTYMPFVALVRHGESEWNAQGLWTGLTDIPLTERGLTEARAAADALAHIPFHCCHCSVLTRAKQTLEEIQRALGCIDIPSHFHPALNERDYGDYTGQHKEQFKRKVGEETFLKIRRSWNEPIPHGETLQDVYKRVVPYFEQHILQDVHANHNVLVSSHGNTLRALVKFLDQIDDDGIANVEIATGEIRLYAMNRGGIILSRQTIAVQQPVAV